MQTKDVIIQAVKIAKTGEIPFAEALVLAQDNLFNVLAGVGVATAITAGVVANQYGPEDVLPVMGAGITATIALGYAVTRVYRLRKSAALPIGNIATAPAVRWADSLLSLPPRHLLMGMDGKQPLFLSTGQHPHFLVSGMSGEGKTRRFLRPVIVSAALAGFQVIVLDRSGKDFYPFEGKRNIHVVRYGDDTLAPILESVYQEVLARQKLLNEHKCSTADRLPAEVRPAEVFLMLDELSNAISTIALTKNGKEVAGRINASLIRLVQEGRSTGIYVMSVVQRPTHDQVNTTFRAMTLPISFKLRNEKENRTADVEGGHALDHGQFVIGRPEYDGRAFDTWHPTDRQLSQALALRPYPELPSPGWLYRGQGGDEVVTNRPSASAIPGDAPGTKSKMAFDTPGGAELQSITGDVLRRAIMEVLSSTGLVAGEDAPADDGTAHHVSRALTDKRPSNVRNVTSGQYKAIVLCWLTDVGKNETQRMIWGDKSGPRAELVEKVIREFQNSALAKMEEIVR